MARRLSTKTINRFKGINAWESVAIVKPDEAIDCCNVFISGSGGLEKMRAPVDLSEQVPNLTGIGNIVNYQNALGIRQVIAVFEGYFYKFDLDTYAATQIEYNALNSGVTSFTQSNNIMFMANGSRMMKWTGTALQNWGIAQPAAPSVSLSTIPSVADPAVAPTLTIIYPGSYYGYHSRTYNVTYTWVNGIGETLQSTPAALALASNQRLRITVPAPPAGVTGYRLYLDPLGAAARKRIDSERLEALGNSNPISTTILTVDEPGPFMWEDFLTDDDPPVLNTTGSGRIMTTGRSYRVAYGNSVTGHVGAASDPSASTGAITNTDQIDITVTTPTDTQCDQIWIFSTMDGGGDYYLLPNPNSTDGSFTPSVEDKTTIIDWVADEDLNKAIIAPLLNFPPPVGKYACEWGGRIFVSNLANSKQEIAYSGYERIYLGRPEESFPPNNRLRLAIGSDEISGHGVIQAGIVAFSISNEMFMLRGTVTDKSTDAPVEYLAELEKLPWNTGCASHFSIARSPYGLIWLASDKTIKIYNGIGAPLTLAGGLLPYLRRITPGTENDCRGAFYCFLEREWYLLLCSLDGSPAKNYIFVVDLEPDMDKNVGGFPLNVQADAMDMVEDVHGINHLVIMQNGYAKELIINSDTTGAISVEYSQTSTIVPAFWRSGYFGNESPDTIKLFRFGKLETDQLGFSLQHYLVDGNFRNPEIVPFSMLMGQHFEINQKNRRLSTEIKFPEEDVAANVLGLSITHIKTSER